MVRENLYVAMTRGRHANRVYVAVDDVDPTCDYLSDPHATPAGRDVLERILATTGAERSATQTITARQNEAGSLKRLEPIRQTLLADAVTHHWTATLHDVGLTPEQVDAVVASPEGGPLFVALERGTTLGRPMCHLLRGLIADRPLSDPADYLSDPHATPAGRDVLERILATTGAERSATQTIAARQNEAGSLKRLQPIRQTLLADAVAHHWAATLHDVGLTPEQVDTVIASPEGGPLLVALERGATLGRQMDHVLRDLITASPLGDSTDPAIDIAAVLHARVQAWLHTQVDNPQTITTTTPRPEDLRPIRPRPCARSTSSSPHASTP